MALERNDAELLHALIEGCTDANGDCSRGLPRLKPSRTMNLQAVNWLVEAGADIISKTIGKLRGSKGSPRQRRYDAIVVSDEPPAG